MRRDPLVFTAAGAVFGLVVGYMAASWDVVPRPAAAGAGAAAPAPPPAAPPPPAARPAVVPDPGAGLVSAGRPAEALAEFERVLRADPGHRNALYNKGIALMQMGRGDEAVAAWEELLKHHPEDPQLQGLRGRLEQIRAASAGGK